LTASRSPDELLTIDGRKWLWAQLGPLQEHLEPLALSVGKIEIQYLWNHANKWSGKEMAARLKDFRSKLERELNHRFFLYLTEEEAAQFRSAQPFGPEVASAFPAIVNVELCEASKCLALGRHTACVFHLMRVMEAAVQVFGKKLGATLVKSAAPGKRVSAWGGAIPPQPYGRRTSGGDGNDDAGSCALGVNDRPHVPTVHVGGLPLQAPLMLGRFLASRPARGLVNLFRGAVSKFLPAGGNGLQASIARLPRRARPSLSGPQR